MTPSPCWFSGVCCCSGCCRGAPSCHRRYARFRLRFAISAQDQIHGTRPTCCFLFGHSSSFSFSVFPADRSTTQFRQFRVWRCWLGVGWREHLPPQQETENAKREKSLRPCFSRLEFWHSPQGCFCWFYRKRLPPGLS